MSKIAPVIFLACFVPPVLMFGYFFLYMRFSNVRDLGTPFECGFDPKMSSRVPFSLRFFMLAVIFLIFDVEVALLFPIPYILSGLSFTKSGVILGVFLLILFIGLFHEWNEGSLSWV